MREPRILSPGRQPTHRMKLAILHYHLNHGGVTRVIANHLLALDAVQPPGAMLEVLVLSDGQVSGWSHDLVDRLKQLNVQLVTVSSLAYGTGGGTVPNPQAIATELREVLTTHGYGPDTTVLHAHNHSLGKNQSFPRALRQLASEGYPLLLQIHDFAEDFRPDNYRQLRESCGADGLSAAVYYQAPHVHYTTLNRRDFSVLQTAGVPEDRLHFLPNPVPELGELPSRSAAKAALARQLGVSEDDRYVLYPVRGIRRKNVGEMLLLSLLMNSGDRPAATLAITLAPLNPVALPYYDRWMSLAAELRLKCLFDTGGDSGLSFAENLVAANCILTTSVAEGFGMVFLESWLAGRPLIGRNLPEITADFVEAGLDLSTLYDQLSVPLEWVGRDDLFAAMEDTGREMYAHYGVSWPGRSAVAAAIDRMTDDGTIDFGRLNEPLQERIIGKVQRDVSARDELCRLNPALAGWSDADEPTVAANQKVIRKSYSLQASGERLRSMYKAVIESPRGPLEQPADAGSILSAFLDLQRFHLIRT